MAQHLDVPLDIVTVDARQLADEIESLVTLLDEPLADPAALNVLHICRRAREQGIKVLLSGAGGDDLFTGYRRHQALQLERWWSWLPMSGRKVLETGSRSLDQRRPLGRRLRKLFNGAALEGDERLIRYFSWFDNDALADLYTPQFRAAVSDAAAPMKAFLADLPPATSRLERMLALEQRFFLADHNLIYTDKMSMAAGVEVRVPLIDLELVEYAARLPARFKQRGAVGKWVLKKAMEPYLPKEVIYRPKTGFGVPLRRWIRHELRTLLGDILSEESLRRRGIFDARAVQRLMAANDEGAVDASYTLLSLLCVELWCRAFIDKAEAGSGGGAQIGGERLCSPARR